MSIQKKKRNGKPTPNIEQILSENADIREYFNYNYEKEQFGELVVELLREAIRNRANSGKSKSKEKHYHVAYVKHNRFLSPSQKQEVTEKVTQIIPVNQKPIKIYAKPKPKSDQQEYLNGNGFQEGSITEIAETKREEALSVREERSPKQNIIDLSKEKQQAVNKKQESSKYLSPKSQRRPQQNNKIERNRAKVKEYVSPVQKQTIKEYYSPKSKEAISSHQNRLNIESNYKSTFREVNRLEIPIVVSPRVKQNYEQVESRIKFLIDRDKHNKKTERLLEQQSKKIDKLEERQEKLLLLQYEQERQILRNNQISQYMRQQPSDSSDSESVQPAKTYHKLSAISHQLDAINQRAEGVRDYQSTLYANLEKMRDKTYKISSNPVYPISSSQSSDESDMADDY